MRVCDKRRKADCTVMQKNVGGAEKHTTVHVSEPDITSQMQNEVGRAHGESVSKRTAPETGGKGDGMLSLSSLTRAKEAKQVSQCTIHAQRRTRLKLFFFLKKGCTSAPCSMRHLKLTLQVLQLQPLATHRNVASGYRHEVRGSSVPFSVSTSPLILHSCGKGNDNKMLGVLPTLTRTSQQKSLAHAIITNMPATVDARSLVPQDQERNNNNNNKRMILPCSSQHMLHFSLLQRHVYDACRKSVLLCAEEKL